MIVRISAEAEADLEAIADFIATGNPRRAISFVQELRARCVEIADTPEAYPLLARHELRGVRRRVHGAYLIFYRVTADTVDVVHVLHGAQDYDSLL